MSPAELERLAILSEELGEVQQVIGKILRHGYDSNNPLEENGKSNREKLEMELGDVNVMVIHMMNIGDIDELTVMDRTHTKKEKLNKWMHYNKIEI